MTPNSIDPITNNRKNIFFIKSLSLKNGKNTSNAHILEPTISS